jgi:hypothetical protein
VFRSAQFLFDEFGRRAQRRNFDEFRRLRSIPLTLSICRRHLLDISTIRRQRRTNRRIFKLSRYHKKRPNRFIRKSEAGAKIFAAL